MRRQLARLTVEQWRAMADEHAALPPASAAEQHRALGLYLVVCLSLLGTNYFTGQATLEALSGPLTGTADQRELTRLTCWALATAAWYALPGALYAWLVMGLSPADLGLRLRPALAHWWLYAAGLAVVMPCVVVVAHTPAFQATYPLLHQERWTAAGLLRWELAYAAQFVGLELFFRGVMIQGPRRALGPWVIPAMVIPYAMIHDHKPPLEYLGAIIAGCALGVVSYRTRSLVGGAALHIAVAWSMDGLALWLAGRLPA